MSVTGRANPGSFAPPPHNLHVPEVPLKLTDTEKLKLILKLKFNLYMVVVCPRSSDPFYIVIYYIYKIGQYFLDIESNLFGKSSQML